MYGKAETSGDMLKRLITLMLWLAGIAESAAWQPRPVRAAMLFFLRRAEISARRLVAGDASYLRVAPWLMSSAEAHHGTSRAAAMSLGLCFRLLALALSNLVALSRRFAGALAGRVFPALDPALTSDRAEKRAPKPPDTS